MSETQGRPRWLIALALEIPREAWRDVEEHYKQDIAAAEERGRRAGIEERDELRARLWEALSVIESRAPDMTLLIPRIKVALAPRDSGHDAILCGPNCPGHAATVRK